MWELLRLLASDSYQNIVFLSKMHKIEETFLLLFIWKLHSLVEVRNSILHDTIPSGGLKKYLSFARL